MENGKTPTNRCRCVWQHCKKNYRLLRFFIFFCFYIYIFCCWQQCLIKHVSYTAYSLCYTIVYTHMDFITDYSMFLLWVNIFSTSMYFPDVVYDSVLHISLNMSYESNLKFSNRNITSMNKAIVFLAVMKTNFKKKVLVKCNNTKLNRHLKSKEFIKV